MDLQPYRAIIFDLFHTLTSADILRAPGKGTSEILGVSREDWNKQLLVYSEDRLRGEITDPYEIIEKMAHAIDPAISIETIQTAVKNRTERFRYALMCIEESTLNTLSKLKSAGKLLGLVSNADVSEIAGWEGSQLEPFFDAVIFSCRVGYFKPEREIYEICLQKLNVLPEECVYVGDGGSDELRGAKDLGMTTVMTIHVIKRIWPERIAAARVHADHTIDGVAQLLKLQ
jgi:putative hydrolase of the HAD superfamily